jgi:hypothetical protein
LKALKRIFLGLVGVLVIIQFFHPSRNISAGNSPNHITARFTVPQDVQTILQTSCYDCHSNNTRYPWYFNIQPPAWLMNSHIQDGKKRLNFSEFSGYRLRRQYSKFEAIATEVSEGGMPLPSYLLIHTDAKLSQEQKEKLVAWTNVMRDTMKARYPADSLTTGK